MAFNGSGTFNRVYNWVTDLGNSVPVTASRMDTEQDGIATGLSNCITKDGQTTVTANIPMNSKKFTGLANGSARTDSIALGQVQDGAYTTLGTAGGAADVYTATPSPAITAYATGSRFIIKIQADNTGASTLNINAVAAKDIKKYDGAGAKVALEAGDLQQDQYYDIFYDGTDIVVLNPQLPYIDLTNATNYPRPAGDTIQVVNTQSSTGVTGTTLIPADDTIPQNTEGDEYMTLAITPTNASNKLKIDVVFFGTTTNSGDRLAVALFQDTTVGSLATGVHTTSGAGRVLGVKYTHYMAAGTTSSTTFKIRAGGNASGTTTFNGQSGNRLYGGVMASSITITEIQV